MTIYLYLKTHNKTGYKYLGKTISDPYTYKGSGLLWKRHIKKHGYDVTTEILFSSDDKEEFKKVATKFSQDFNIVESKEFANLCPEEGQGGHTIYHEERNNKISDYHKGKPKDYDLKGINKNMTVARNTLTNEVERVSVNEFHSRNELIGIGSKNKGVKKSDEHKSKLGRKGMIMLKSVSTGKCVRIKKEDVKNYDLDVWKNPASKWFKGEKA